MLDISVGGRRGLDADADEFVETTRGQGSPAKRLTTIADCVAGPDARLVLPVLVGRLVSPILMQRTCFLA